MTTLVDRPAPPTASTGGTDARRAIIRWAWRLYRREWRQQVLTLLLLIVAVAATIVGLGVVTNIHDKNVAGFGTASVRIDVSLTVPSHIGPDIALARQTFGTVETIAHTGVAVPGSIRALDVRDQSPTGQFAQPMLRLAQGSYPAAAGDIAVTRGAATTFGLQVGSVWQVMRASYRVVGIVENPQDLQENFALVAPGAIASPTTLTVLAGTAGNSALRAFRPSGGDSVSIGTTSVSGPANRRAQSLGVLLLATIGLLFVGLLSVAGFTVMAQRRVRSLGMIRAVGATDRQVRLVMLANGASVGVVGALAGMLSGLIIWVALAPAFEHLVGRRIDTFALQWWAVGATVLLAIVTALLASWWPARAAARVPIVAALSGRPAPPRPGHRFAAAGIAVTALGFVLLVLARQRNAPEIVGGIVATAGGMLLLTPLGIQGIARIGRRAPIAVRLALRDLARYQARSGAALAAVSLAVGIAATIAVSAAAQAAADHTASSGNLPANQLVVWIAGPPGPKGPGGGASTPATGISDAQLSQLAARVSSLAADIHTSSVLPLFVASNGAAESEVGGPRDAQVMLVKPVNGGEELLGVPYVATPQLLAFYGIAPSAIDGVDVLTSRTGTVHLDLADRARTRDVTTPSSRSNRLLPHYSSAPNTVISPTYVRAHGLVATPVGWLVRTPNALTAQQIVSAEHDAAALGLSVETRAAPDHSLQKLRDYSTATGLAVALGVLAMTVGLIRSETANDLRTLSATGAGTRTRRSITAATAGALGLLGGVLGVGGAYLALIAWHWRDLHYLGHLPYWDLAILVLGLPAAAIIGGWLAAWRAPTGIAHRPLE